MSLPSSFISAVMLVPAAPYFLVNEISFDSNSVLALTRLLKISATDSFLLNVKTPGFT
jgi:hypothetical protein